MRFLKGFGPFWYDFLISLLCALAGPSPSSADTARLPHIGSGPMADPAQGAHQPTHSWTRNARARVAPSQASRPVRYCSWGTPCQWARSGTAGQLRRSMLTRPRCRQEPLGGSESSSSCSDRRRMATTTASTTNGPKATRRTSACSTGCKAPMCMGTVTIRQAPKSR